MPPENQNQNQEEDQNNSTESSQEQTQQTSSQEDRVIDPDYVASLEARIAEQQIQNRRMEQLIEGIRESRTQETQPTPRDVEADRQAFYTDPIGSLDERLNNRDQRILNEMKKMLAPLQSVADNFRVNSEYDRMKLVVKNDPIFGKGLRDPDIEGIVDTIMKSGSVEITEENIKSAVAQAAGMKSLGGVRSNNRNTNHNPNNQVDPPMIPSNRGRIDSGAPVRKELTEDDRLAMRMAGLKPGNPQHEDEYWSLISDPVMTLEVHKKKEGK